MSLREGSRVCYVGDGSDGRALGDRGRLLLRSGSSGHVRWDDGTIAPHYLADLEALAWSRQAAAVAADGLEDSLEVGPIQTVAVREAYEAEGSAGVLNQLSTTGALGGFAEIAQEARELVVARLRQDPTLGQATAALDDDEREDLILTATYALLRDAFSGENE
jgi:hypothetical protein